MSVGILVCFKSEDYVLSVPWLGQHHEDNAGHRAAEGDQAHLQPPAHLHVEPTFLKLAVGCLWHP